MIRRNLSTSKSGAAQAVAFEGLEGRTLYAATPPLVTAEVVSNTLVVTGTRLSDTIQLSPNAGDGNLVDVLSGTSTVGSFDRAGFAEISVSGLNGHDTIAVDGTISLKATLLGGNGRDTLTGGAGGDLIQGGNGRDTLYGRAGDDTLEGGNAKDVLAGGDGNDSLSGGRGKDTVTGGLGTDTYLGDRATEILEKAEDEVLVPPVKGKK